MSLRGLKESANAAAKRASRAAAGMLLCAVGAGFLTAAAWIALAEMRDALFATLVIGAGYVGLGLIFLGLSRATRHAAPTTPPPQRGYDPQGAAVYPIAALVEAFATGVSAGIASRAGTRRSGRED